MTDGTDNAFYALIDKNYSVEELDALDAVETEEVYDRSYKIAVRALQQWTDTVLGHGLDAEAIVKALTDVAEDIYDALVEGDD